MSSIVKKGGGLSALKSAIKTDSMVTSGEVARAIASEALVMCIDCSGSMFDTVEVGSKKKKNEAAAEAAIALLDACGPGSVVGAVAFADVVHEVVEIGENRSKVRDALRGFPRYDGGTIFWEALKAAHKEIGQRASGKKVRRIILLTDGLDWPEFRQQLLDLLPVLKREGIVVDCVAFGQDADRELLALIAKETSGVVKEANDSAGLVKAFLALEAGVRGLLAAR
jgi:Mg-chelatase subunit ChlD